MALGQKLRDVMGTDPRPRLLSRGQRSSAGLLKAVSAEELAQGRWLWVFWSLMHPGDGSYSPANCLLQRREAGPAGDGEKPWPGDAVGCPGSRLHPPLSNKAGFCHVTPQLWGLHRNGAPRDFSSFPFHLGDKALFSQLSSCRCSVGDNSRSRGFRGIFSGFVLSPTLEFCLVLNSSEFRRSAKIIKIHIIAG